ncbi:hypothetical protein IAT38_005047 [Cryptococcus sp. DSM 104549]
MFATAVLLLLLPLIAALPPHFPLPQLPGKYVPFSQLHLCPVLPSRPPPKHPKDVRPDDFKVVMALGDSITAGLLARGSRDPPIPRNHRSSSSSFPPSSSDSDTQRPLSIFPSLLDVQEYRGLSYAVGSDPGAITIPHIIGHFAGANVTGGSRGKHPPVACLEGFGIGVCGPRPEGDGLNAGISGSVSAGLEGQVRDYLLPRLKELDVKDEDWKYVNLGIGANDICSFCLSPNVTGLPFSGSPQNFAKDIKHAVNLLREHVPNIIVNIIGLFRVSAIYHLTLKDPYCQPPLLPVPHLPLECSCALLPGPAGDWTRARMDELGEAYDKEVLEVVREWEEEDAEGFGVVWQPGTAVDLANYPITALSPIDCFHPSEAAHQRMAAGIWNRLTLDLEDKYQAIKWEDEVWVRCIEEGDRIPVGMVSEALARKNGQA